MSSTGGIRSSAVGELLRLSAATAHHMLARLRRERTEEMRSSSLGTTSDTLPVLRSTHHRPLPEWPALILRPRATTAADHNIPEDEADKCKRDLVSSLVAKQVLPVAFRML